MLMSPNDSVAVDQSPTHNGDEEVDMDIDGAEDPNPQLESPAETANSTSPPPLDTPVQVVGPFGQVCENAQVLAKILKVYTHIPSNQFKGGANGRIPTECMMCECRYDPDLDDHQLACGTRSDCINRALSIECPPECPCGPFCLNQRYSHSKSDSN